MIKSFKFNPVMAIRLVLSPLVPLMPALIQAFLGTALYKKHFVLYFLLHNFSTNVQTYRLMVSNMTKRVPFNPMGLETFFGFIPLLAHLLAPESAKELFEKSACLLVLPVLVFFFYGHIYFLSQQWLEREEGRRRWWTISAREKDQ